VSDFGSQRLSANTSKDLTIMAPELKGPGASQVTFGCKQSVYSFAMIMFQLYTQTLINPLDAADPNWRPTFSQPAAHQKLENLIKRCWDSEPERRPDHQTILNELFRMNPIAGDS
jgi:hypothetical protein